KNAVEADKRKPPSQNDDDDRPPTLSSSSSEDPPPPSPPKNPTVIDQIPDLVRSPPRRIEGSADGTGGGVPKAPENRSARSPKRRKIDEPVERGFDGRSKWSRDSSSDPISPFVAKKRSSSKKDKGIIYDYSSDSENTPAPDLYRSRPTADASKTSMSPVP
ncbi:unnamed protein product, partial [Amoebophrya sp. A120]